MCVYDWEGGRQRDGEVGIEADAVDVEDRFVVLGGV